MRNGRRFCSLTLTAVLALGLIVAAAPAGAQEIRLAFTPPITGASAAEGALQIKAIDLAIGMFA